jgi:hypothetical protein
MYRGKIFFFASNLHISLPRPTIEGAEYQMDQSKDVASLVTLVLVGVDMRPLIE